MSVHDDPTQEFIDRMTEHDKWAEHWDNIRRMEREGASEVAIQARMIQGFMAPSLTARGR